MKNVYLTTLVCTCVLLWASTGVRADIWEILNPALADLREKKSVSLAELESLGAMNLGNTCEQIGSQFHMAETPPAVPPFVQIDLGYSQDFDTVVVVPAVTDFSNEGNRSYAFPTAFRVDISNDQEFATFQSIGRIDDTSLEGQLGLPIVFDCETDRARYIRLTVLELAQVADRWTYALGEIMVLSGNRNLAVAANTRMQFAPRMPPKWHYDYLVDGRTPLGPPIQEELPELDGAYSAPASPDGAKWMMVDVGAKMLLQEVRLHPIHARQGNSLPGYSFPRRFRVELFRDDTLQNGTAVFDSGDEEFSNPGNNPVTILFPEVEARFVRVTCIEPSRLDPRRMGLAEIMVFTKDRNVALEGTVSMNGQTQQRGPELLNDGYSSYGKILDLSEWVDRWHRLRSAHLEISSLERNIRVAEQAALRRGQWIGGFSVLALTCGFGIFGLIRRRKAIQERNQFRQRLAQDLHDEVGSNLAAIARLGEVAELESNDPQSQQDWQSVRQLALECTDSMRETLWLLGGPRHARSDLLQRLRETAKRMLPHVQLQWEQSASAPHFDEESQMPRQLFLIFKEILANIAKHSQADHVQVQIEHSDVLTITVKDNGIGSTDRTTNGMGLGNIRERTTKLGGRFHFDSSSGQGTTIKLEIPFRN